MPLYEAGAVAIPVEYMNDFQSSILHHRKEKEKEEEQDLRQDTQSLSEETSKLACLAIATTDDAEKENEDYRKRPLDGSPKAKHSALRGPLGANMYDGLVEERQHHHHHRTHHQQRTADSLLTSHLRMSHSPPRLSSKPSLPISNLSEQIKPLTGSPSPNVGDDPTNFDMFDSLAELNEREVVDRTNSWANSVPYGPPPMAAAVPPIEQAGQHLEELASGNHPVMLAICRTSWLRSECPRHPRMRECLSRTL